MAEGKPLDTKLADVMTKNPLTVSPETPLVVVAARIVEHNIRHLPVVDENSRPLGMLSIRDVLKHVL